MNSNHFVSCNIEKGIGKSNKHIYKIQNMCTDALRLNTLHVKFILFIFLGLYEMSIMSFNNLIVFFYERDLS